MDHEHTQSPKSYVIKLALEVDNEVKRHGWGATEKALVEKETVRKALSESGADSSSSIYMEKQKKKSSNTKGFDFCSESLVLRHSIQNGEWKTK